MRKSHHDSSDDEDYFCVAKEDTSRKNSNMPWKNKPRNGSSSDCSRVADSIGKAVLKKKPRVQVKNDKPGVGGDNDNLHDTDSDEDGVHLNATNEQKQRCYATKKASDEGTLGDRELGPAQTAELHKIPGANPKKKIQSVEIRKVSLYKLKRLPVETTVPPLSEFDEGATSLDSHSSVILPRKKKTITHSVSREIPVVGVVRSKKSKNQASVNHQRKIVSACATVPATSNIPTVGKIQQNEVTVDEVGGNSSAVSKIHAPTKDISDAKSSSFPCNMAPKKRSFPANVPDVDENSFELSTCCEIQLPSASSARAKKVSNPAAQDVLLSKKASAETSRKSVVAVQRNRRNGENSVQKATDEPNACVKKCPSSSSARSRINPIPSPLHTLPAEKAIAESSPERVVVQSSRCDVNTVEEKMKPTALNCHLSAASVAGVVSVDSKKKATRIRIAKAEAKSSAVDVAIVPHKDKSKTEKSHAVSDAASTLVPEKTKLTESKCSFEVHEGESSTDRDHLRVNSIGQSPSMLRTNGKTKGKKRQFGPCSAAVQRQEQDINDTTDDLITQLPSPLLIPTVEIVKCLPPAVLFDSKLPAYDAQSVLPTEKMLHRGIVHMNDSDVVGVRVAKANKKRTAVAANSVVSNISRESFMVDDDDTAAATRDISGTESAHTASMSLSEKSRFPANEVFINILSNITQCAKRSPSKADTQAKSSTAQIFSLEELRPNAQATQELHLEACPPVALQPAQAVPFGTTLITQMPCTASTMGLNKPPQSIVLIDENIRTPDSSRDLTTNDIVMREKFSQGQFADVGIGNSGPFDGATYPTMAITLENTAARTLVDDSSRQALTLGVMTRSPQKVVSQCETLTSRFAAQLLTAGCLRCSFCGGLGGEPKSYSLSTEPTRGRSHSRSRRRSERSEHEQASHQLFACQEGRSCTGLYHSYCFLPAIVAQGHDTDCSAGHLGCPSCLARRTRAAEMERSSQSSFLSSSEHGSVFNEWWQLCPKKSLDPVEAARLVQISRGTATSLCPQRQVSFFENAFNF